MGNSFREDSRILRYITVPIIILNNMLWFKGGLGFFRLFVLPKSVDTHRGGNGVSPPQPGLIRRTLRACGMQEKTMTGLALRGPRSPR